MQRLRHGRYRYPVSDKKLSNGAVAGIRSGHSLNRRPGEPEGSEAATVGRIEDM